MNRTIEVSVPDIGDIHDVPVIEVLARVGAAVALDETLIVLETEKATMDVPSTAAGTVREVRVRQGDKVSRGSLIVLLEDAGEETGSPTPAPAQAAQGVTAVVELPVSASGLDPGLAPAPVAPLSANGAVAPGREGVPPHASPSMRRFARELGIDLSRVAGSGPKGRILRGDLQDFVKGTLAAPPVPNAKSGSALDLLPWPEVDYAKFGAIERAPLSKIKKISGANLSRNAIVIPHVTNFDEADITELEKFRLDINHQSHGKGAKLTMLAFLIKASVSALTLHSAFNASLDGNDLVLKRYFHIGFAADTPNGLVVPVIKDADKKGLTAIAAEAGELAAQARNGKLKPSDMQGGCFTVSSLGGIGGTGFTPIINAPEVAILGAARARMTPVWDDSQFLPRLVLPLSLSWDHRVIDGAQAARFLVTLVGLLGDFRRVSL